MVYLALKPEAAAEAIALARKLRCSVWLGSDAIDAVEHKRLVAEGLDVTRFSSPLAGTSPSELDELLATVGRHHPGEVIWVDHHVEREY